MNREDLISQLIKIYMTEEWWHKERLSLEDAWKYFKCLLMKGNIFHKDIDGEVVGYVEFFFLTPQQVKKVDDFGNIPIFEEDLNSGDVCYINNIWIKPGYRGNGMIRSFKKKIESKKDFKYYGGNEVKNNNRLRVWEK